MNKNYVGFFNCTTKEELNSFKEELLEYPNDCQKLLMRSRRFVSGEYLFDNEWDMERTHESIHWQLAEIQWGDSPNNDPEWNYMLNRHRFLVDIGLAYLLTEEEIYKRYLADFLQAFIEHNPLNEQTKGYSWRTIDVGLRVVHWLKLLEIHRHFPLFTPELAQRMEEEISHHGKYLYDHLSIERGQSNWQVLEIAGLYSISLAYHEWASASDWRVASLAYLEESLALQVEEDGMQREQSFMYHNEVLLSLLQIIQLAQRNQQEIPELILNYAKKTTQAAASFVKPDGKQPVYGDSDLEDMTGLLQYAEGIVSPSSFAKKRPTFFAKQSFGYGEFPLENKFLSVFSVHHFQQAGLMIAKTPEDYTLFKCGPLGGGHGHDDLLHVSYTHRDKDILIDSGRYSYEVSKGRLDYKAPYAHNTIVVDDQNFNHHTDAWNSEKVASPINQKLLSHSGIHFFEGGHLGYFDLSDPVYLNRKLIHFPEGFCLISDSYFCHGAHNICTYFHFNSNDVQLTQRGLILEDLDFELISLDERMKATIEDTVVSPTYNETKSICCGILKKEIQRTDTSSYVLAPQGLIQNVEQLPVYAEDQKQSPNVVEAIKFTFEEGTQQLVILQHQEPNVGRRAYRIEGKYYYGRIMVVKDNKRMVLY